VTAAAHAPEQKVGGLDPAKLAGNTIAYVN
jgi:hypothetical protein